MKRLWVRMAMIFGGLWSSQYGQADDGTWRSALRHVSNETLADAIGRVALSNFEFPPNLPKFLAICARSAGLPDSQSAYADAAMSRWSHPIVYEAARRVGVFEIRTRPERDMRPAWTEAFGLVCAEWMSGKRFESPTSVAIEKLAPKPCSAAGANKFLAAARFALGVTGV